MKRWMGILSGLALMAMAVGPVWADYCPHGRQCPMATHQRMDDDKAECGCPILSKVLKKSKFLLEYADEIGLSEQQVAEIKAIKLEAKKTSIRVAAEMKVFELDVQAKMSEPKLDVEGLNAMIDTASQGMSTGAKASVATYAKLRGLLSEEQQKKVKELWKKRN
ncbi:MAG: hypothetical protein HYT88_06700 [Candidatus Omnitrophica bacterium]|nr:hypothetical protein [Candidatus Omnitrophota bacterium]MBI2175072.1 hypothetical protein [Candidatus Omnitrophota bacterium]